MPPYDLVFQHGIISIWARIHETWGYTVRPLKTSITVRHVYPIKLRLIDKQVAIMWIFDATTSPTIACCVVLISYINVYQQP